MMKCFGGKGESRDAYLLGSWSFAGRISRLFVATGGTAPGGSGRFAPPVPEDVLQRIRRAGGRRFRWIATYARVVVRTHLESIACWSPKKSTRCASFFSLTWCDSGMIAMGRTAARVAHRARCRRDCATRLMVTRGGGAERRARRAAATDERAARRRPDRGEGIDNVKKKSARARIRGGVSSAAPRVRAARHLGAL